MKYLLFSIVLLFACNARADDLPKVNGQPAVQQKPGVTIIDGKKFFPLSGVKHFNGSPNSPAALQVTHHPHTQPGIRNNFSAPLKPEVSAESSFSPASGSATASVPGGKPGPSDVLSLFAPDDKAAPAPGMIGPPAR